MSKPRVRNGIPVVMPATQGNASRYGMLSFGGYLDKDGIMTNYAVMGADVNYTPQRNGGQVTIARIPVLASEKKPGKITAMEDWLATVEQALTKLKDTIRADNKIVEIDDNHIKFKSRYDMEKMMSNEIWQTACLAIYEAFNPNIVLRKEAFYMLSDIAGQVGWEFKVGKDGAYECFIKTPPDTQSAITRVRVNKGVWVAWCTKWMGFKPKVTPFLWREYYKVHNRTPDKAVTLEDLMGLLDRRSQCPMDLETHVVQLDWLIMNIVQLKLYELTRQNLDLPNWFFDTDWFMIIRNVSDQQVARNFDHISEDWGHGQVRVPPGDLPHIDTMYKLPVTDHHDWTVIGIIEMTAGDWEEEPAMCITEIVRDSVERTLYWSEYKIINAVDAEVFIVYNKTFGTFFASNIDVEAAILINSVYPTETYMQKPYSVGMRLEERHWSVDFETIDAVKPMAATKDKNVHFLFGQKTWLGPKYYLVDVANMLEDSLNFDMYSPNKGYEDSRSHRIAEINQIELDQKEAEKKIRLDEAILAQKIVKQQEEAMRKELEQVKARQEAEKKARAAAEAKAAELANKDVKPGISPLN